MRSGFSGLGMGLSVGVLGWLLVDSGDRQGVRSSLAGDQLVCHLDVQPWGWPPPTVLAACVLDAETLQWIRETVTALLDLRLSGGGSLWPSRRVHGVSRGRGSEDTSERHWRGDLTDGRTGHADSQAQHGQVPGAGLPWVWLRVSKWAPRTFQEQSWGLRLEFGAQPQQSLPVLEAGSALNGSVRGGRVLDLVTWHEAPSGRWGTVHGRQTRTAGAERSAWCSWSPSVSLMGLEVGCVGPFSFSVSATFLPAPRLFLPICPPT